MIFAKEPISEKHHVFQQRRRVTTKGWLETEARMKARPNAHVADLLGAYEALDRQHAPGACTYQPLA